MIVEEKNIHIQDKFNTSLKDVHLSLLRQGRDVYVRSRGMSMYPFIKDQDKTIVKERRRKNFWRVVAASEPAIAIIAVVAFGIL